MSAWSSDARLGLVANAGNAQRKDDRKVKKLVYPREPVKITDVKSKIGMLGVDRSVSADDDWFEGFGSLWKTVQAKRSPA